MYHQAVNGMVHGLLCDQEPTVANASDVVAALGVLVIAFGLVALSYIYFEHRSGVSVKAGRCVQEQSKSGFRGGD
jgi:hypothetical protein